jgi:hypothetical protein
LASSILDGVYFTPFRRNARDADALPPCPRESAIGEARRRRYAGHMRRTALGLTFAASLLAPAAHAARTPDGVDLWHGATLGMDIDQVQARFPESRAWSGQSLENGALAALILPAQLAGAPADAIFFFRGRALASVIVERRDLPRGDRAQNLAEARRLVAQATQAYGRPRNCSDRGDIAVVDCVWFPGDLRVAVGYHDFGGGAPMLGLSYGPAR